MKAILIDKFVQDYDEIKVSEVPKPQPRNDEVLVQIAAAGVNFVDLLYSRGKHQNNRSLVRPPFILGLEFAGTVISAPSNSKFKPGDRVFGGGLGGFAQYTTTSPSNLHAIPPTWSYSTAATFAATLPVSYGALITRCALRPGETVLIHGASGALGLAAIQISKAVGARVIATASSQTKLDICKRFGADEVIDYSEDKEWWKTVSRLSKGKGDGEGGVDVVFDGVGLVSDSLRCLRWKGRVLVVGFAGREGDLERVAMNRVLLKQAVVIGYRFGETGRLDPKETEKIWKGLEKMWEKGLLKPMLFDREYRSLESVVGAMKDLSQRKVWGKAVVLIEQNQEAENKARL